MKKAAFVISFLLCLSIGLTEFAPHTHILQEPLPLTESSGLGDSAGMFEQNYGPNSGDREIGRFQNGLINPLFLDNKAYEVMIDFEQSENPRQTKQEAMEFISHIIPVDSVKQKEYIAPNDSSREIIEYKSLSLQKVFSEERHIFKQAAPGTFTVALRKDKQGYYRAVVGTGSY